MRRDPGRNDLLTSRCRRIRQLIPMENIQNKLRALLDRREWTEEEKAWFLEYIETTPAGELRSLMEARFYEQTGQRIANTAQDYTNLEALMLDQIHKKMTPARGRELRMWVRRVAAAAAVFMLVWSGYRLFHPRTAMQFAVHSPHQPNHQQPKGTQDKATLTLGDGTTVVLDDEKNGDVARQGVTRVVKLDGGLAYNADKPASPEASNPSGANPSGTNPSGETIYNTLSVPRGKQYQVVLQDGTKVFLDAASSIRFPTAFNGKERRVEITGEAWFEVAKNATMPFVVRVRQSEVQVLGTSFNISAYEDEAMLKTTLVEGSVRFVAMSGSSAQAGAVAQEANSRMLRPGQQTQLSKDGKIKVLNNVDVAEVLAWKNGLFHFDGQGIQSIMNQLARWYDVEIVYENKRPVDLFSADIPRGTRLPDLLKALELTRKVKFRTEGRRITVLE
jgi:transmembrane sensor